MRSLEKDEVGPRLCSYVFCVTRWDLRSVSAGAWERGSASGGSETGGTDLERSLLEEHEVLWVELGD